MQISLAADAALGERELRLVTPNGLTNPVIFCVGQLPEISTAAQATPIEITLPVLINGQIKPGGVDRFRFQATQGQHFVIAAKARELLPYISDAVPGWFQATLSLTNSQGREVRYADHFLFHPDPVLYYEIPADGPYTLEIHDSIYRGREDFVYRIEVGELPFVTAIFPLGGRSGTDDRRSSSVALELKGWNLPPGKLTENTENRARRHLSNSARSGDLISNRVPFAVDTLPETLDKEPNNRHQNAQRITLPVIVNGRIDRPGDWDVFRFDGRAGDEIVAEVYARRLDSPLDSILRLTDAAGRELAVNDDAEDKGAALLTHQADSRLLFKLPARGASASARDATLMSFSVSVARPVRRRHASPAGTDGGRKQPTRTPHSAQPRCAASASRGSPSTTAVTAVAGR